jgi:hypothetical protein
MTTINVDSSVADKEVFVCVEDPYKLDKYSYCDKRDNLGVNIVDGRVEIGICG